MNLSRPLRLCLLWLALALVPRFAAALTADQVKAMAIGEIRPDGQFNVVWRTKAPVKAQPWSPFIEGNDKKKDEPEKK